MTASLIFILLGNLCWMLTYINIIYGNHMFKTNLMIPVSLCLNISWEFLYAFVYPPSNLLLKYSFMMWFLLDMVMLFQLFQYNPQKNYPNIIVTLVLSFGFIFIFDYSVNYAVQFKNHEAAMLSAFLINLLMSYLFTFENNTHKFLFKTNMAIFKMWGTFFTTVSLFLDDGSLFPLLTKEISIYCGLLCFLLDLMFVNNVTRIV
jgi:hypothetical protein